MNHLDTLCIDNTQSQQNYFGCNPSVLAKHCVVSEEDFKIPPLRQPLYTYTTDKMQTPRFLNIFLVSWHAGAACTLLGNPPRAESAVRDPSRHPFSQLACAQHNTDQEKADTVDKGSRCSQGVMLLHMQNESVFVRVGAQLASWP